MIIAGEIGIFSNILYVIGSPLLLMVFDFKNIFELFLRKQYPQSLEWGIVGILLKNSQVYTLSYDSKVLSGIFEILCEPIIRIIADNYNMIMEKSAQNAYPDFTLFDTAESNKKFAIEVKSTYRQYKQNGELKPFGFTLGSYRSFLRDPKGKKGILYPYSEYIEHWIIGFVYSRNPKCTRTEIKNIIEASQLETPFTNIEYFVQQKFRIAGKKPGSGNTTNIGSIKSNEISDFQNGNGPFHSHEEFEEYWRYY